MKNVNSSHAQIFKMEICKDFSGKVANLFGNKKIKVKDSCTWIDIPVSSVSLSETCPSPNAFIEQELVAVVPDFSFDPSSVSGSTLVKLTYTDGTSKLIGVPDIPVFLVCYKKENPERWEISAKRISSEFSKEIESF